MPDNYNQAQFFKYRDYPRVTEVLGIRRSEQLENWKLRIVAEGGFEELMRVHKEAQDKGKYVHEVLEALFKKEIVVIDGEYRGGDEVTRPLVNGAISWCDKYKPEVIAVEKFLHNDFYRYKGTCDLVCKINNVLWIIDFKTSNSLHPSYGLQLVAYKEAYIQYLLSHNPHAEIPEIKMGIVWLHQDVEGKPKRAWSFKEYNEPMGTFVAHLDIYNWAVEKKEIGVSAVNYQGGTLKPS